MIDILQLIVLFAFLGGAIKFIDQAYDEKAFSIRAAKVVAVMAGVVMGYLMARDSPFSTAFFAAMLISLVLAKKIDNFAFATGTDPGDRVVARVLSQQRGHLARGAGHRVPGRRVRRRDRR